MGLFDKLPQIETRYEELNLELADPQVVSDRERFARLTKEHAELHEVVEAYRSCQALKNQAEEAEELLGDPELGELAAEDLKEARERLAEAEENLRLLLIPKDPLDAKNVILEIRAGTGGEEAGLFAADLFRMYTRYAELKGWGVELLSSNATEIGGFKEVVALIKGKDVFAKLKFESGVHRVQRVPSTESGGRIHTSVRSWRRSLLYPSYAGPKARQFLLDALIAPVQVVDP